MRTIAFDAIGRRRAGAGVSRPAVGEANVSWVRERFKRAIVVMLSGIAADFVD